MAKVENHLSQGVRIMASSKDPRKSVDVPPTGSRNPDPITDAPGSHPIETGIGAAVGGAATGAAVGTVAGPVGTAAQSLALGILGTTLRPNWRPWIGVVLLTGFAAAAFALMPSDRKPSEPVRAISGTVRDPAGKPIAGAEVWFLAAQSRPERETAHAVTDAEGRYALKLDDDWSKTPIHE